MGLAGGPFTASVLGEVWQEAGLLIVPHVLGDVEMTLIAIDSSATARRKCRRTPPVLSSGAPLGRLAMRLRPHYVTSG
ncbi:hypothetical protein ABGB09_22350 [Streptomyces sp. B8F3]|uniref:hypothetical protein n=1 Tax=Streptomyces sp. B8F3 TaxID=3153573 RepID=UPI00325F683C